MKNKHYIGLAISALVSVLLFLAIILGFPQESFSILLDKLFVPVGRILLLVTLGLVIGEVIEATGWTKHLAFLAGPLFRFANLGPRCSAAFTTAFFSGVTANSLLFGFYQNKQISREQLFLTNFLNHFPAFFLHLPTTLFIVLPLTGLAGAIYLLLVFAAIVLRTVLFAIYGHFRLSSHYKDDYVHSTPTNTKPSESRSGVISRIRSKIPGRLARIIQFVVPIYLGVYLLKISGSFDFLQSLLSETAISSLMPVESLSMVVISFLADYTSGFATAGALLHSEVINTKQAVLALLLGNIIAVPLRTLRHQLPRYLGIFSPGLGAKLLGLGQGFRVASLLAVGSVYYVLL